MKKVFFYHGNGTGNRKIGVFNLEDKNDITSEKDVESIKSMIKNLFLIDKSSQECETQEEIRIFELYFPDDDHYPYKQNMEIHYFNSSFVLPIKLYEMLKQEWEKHTGVIKSSTFELDLGNKIIYTTHSMCMSEDKDVLFDYDEMLTRAYQLYDFNRTSR